MDFQSFQSKRGIKARKEKPKNHAMTGYSGGGTFGTRNNRHLSKISTHCRHSGRGDKVTELYQTRRVNPEDR